MVSKELVLYYAYIASFLMKVTARPDNLNVIWILICKRLCNDIAKLLDAGIIYPILDSEWVSPV